MSTADRDRFELCGETCVASALGLDVESVTNWLRQHAGGERAVQTGTTPDELIAACRAHRVQAQVVRGPATHYLATAIGRGHYAAVLVWSDRAGNPVPYSRSARLQRGGIGHWMLGYGLDGNAVRVMQPWGGRLLTYDLRHGEDQRLGIEIHKRIGRATDGEAKPRAAEKPPRPKGRAVPKEPPPTGTASAKPTRARTRAGRQYVVVKGDTLWAIARKHGVALRALLAANPQIKDRNKIYPGQRIRIP